MVFHYVFCSSQHDLLSDADDKHLAYLQTSFFFRCWIHFDLMQQALEQWLPVIDGLHIGQLVEIEAKKAILVKILDIECQLQQLKMS